LHTALPGIDTLVASLALAAGTVIFIRRAVSPSMRSLPEGFARYYTAARWMLWGKDFRWLYLWERFREKARLFGVPEPAEGFADNQPTTALIVAPVAWLRPHAARALWTWANVALYLVAVHVLLEAVEVRDFLPRCLLWTLALVWSPTHDAFRRGEPGVMLFALSAAALTCLTQGRLWLGGGYLGLGLLLKPHAWLLLAAVAIRGQWHTVFGAVAASVVVAVATLPLIRPGTWARFLGREAPATLLGGADPSARFQGIASAVGNLFTYDPIRSPVPWLRAPALAAGLQALLVAFTLVFGLGIAGRSQPQLSDPMAFGAAILAGLIVSPRAAEHHFVAALLPTLALLGRYLGGAGSGWIAWILIVAVALLAAPTAEPNEAKPRRGIGKLAQYPRLLGAIGLFVMCALAPMYHPAVWG